MKNKLNILSILPDALLSFIFLIGLCIPVIVTISSPLKTRSSTENRILAAFPNFNNGISSLLSYPNRFEAYFNDHFGLRDSLVFFHHRIKVQLLKQSPVADVIIGSNNWLFLRTPAYGKKKPSGQELEAMKIHLETKQEWLSNRGIQYLFLPAPNKQSIYPEYLPERQKSGKTVSQLNNLIQYLGQNTTATIVDVRPQLRNAKKECPVYYRTDHHWNDRGAFIAYQGIIDTLKNWFPGISPISLNQMKKRPMTTDGMSLANMMGLSAVLPETYTKLSADMNCAQKRPYKALLPDWSRKARSDNEEEWYRMRIPLHTVCSGQRQKAVIFRDSFFDMMIPFFSAHFQEAVYIWSRFDYSLLEELIPRFRPDVVIEECVESELFLSHIPKEIHKTKGFDFLIAGKKQDAIQEFQKDLKINPDSADSCNNLGVALLQNRNFDAALNMFRAALRKDPSHSKAAENYKRITATVIAMDEEIEKTEQLLRIAPKNSSLNIQLGILLHKRGKPELTIPFYQAALSSRPDNFSALSNLAAAHAAMKRYDTAVDIYQRLTRIYPEKADVNYNLACLYSIQNHIPEAIDSLKKAIRNGYDNYRLIRTDHDLYNIRKTPFYRELLKTLPNPKMEAVVIQ